MIVVQILLTAAAAWAGYAHVCGLIALRNGEISDEDGISDMLVALVLALGFLGLTLR